MNHKTASIHNMPTETWNKIKIIAMRKGVPVHKYIIDMLKKAVKDEEGDNAA